MPRKPERGGTKAGRVASVAALGRGDDNWVGLFSPEEQDVRQSERLKAEAADIRRDVETIREWEALTPQEKSLRDWDDMIDMTKYNLTRRGINWKTGRKMSQKERERAQKRLEKEAKEAKAILTSMGLK